MKVKITAFQGYQCCPEGHTAVMFPFGSIVTGQVAEWALADKAGQRMFDPVNETKVTPPTEAKALRKTKAKK